MLFALTPEEAQFREHIRAFLQQSLPEDLRRAARRSAGVFADRPIAQRWHRILDAAGFAVPHWPVDLGGTGWSPMQHYIFGAELSAADAPERSPAGTHMVAPVLMKFGTEEQKRQWLPGIRSGDHYWCQGYSEPQAGSDLASLQCRARVSDDGRHFILNGTKIWTTHAHFADHMFCLVRTSTEGKRQQGISFLCFTFPAPGITIRPIISVSGEHELNQVFFDDANIPRSALVGELHHGWQVAKFLLEHERGAPLAALLRGRHRRLRAALDASFAQDDPIRGDFERKLIEADCDIDALEALEVGALRALARGERLAPTHPSVAKVLGTELRQRLTEIGLEIAGPTGWARIPMEERHDGANSMHEQSLFDVSAYFNDRAASIYGGTNEIQRNLIARQLLLG